jgi:hypothetical protein
LWLKIGGGIRPWIGLDKKLFLVYKCILKAIFPQEARAVV